MAAIKYIHTINFMDAAIKWLRPGRVPASVRYIDLVDCSVCRLPAIQDNRFLKLPADN